MIPKIIHYCWFGGKELPELAEKCIESWKLYCPDYKIVRWDESSFDVYSNDYVKEAYESKKFAFVTDYVRLYAMYNYGGIYMDTDVQVVQSLDQYLHHHAFSGFESYHDIPTGIMACEKGFKGFADLLDYYTDRHFIKPDGTLDTTTNVVAITEYYEKKGLKRNNSYQVIDGFALYPRIVFCPRKDDLVENKMCQIFTIHHMAGSWLTPEEKKITLIEKMKRKIGKRLRKIFGSDLYDKVRSNLK